MTVHRRNIKDAISQLGATFGKDVVSLIYCTVDSVDEVAQTCNCTPISGIATTSIENVLLKSEPNDGLLLVPAIDSTVIVGISDKNIPFVILYEDLEKINLKIGESTMDFIDGEIKFNGGSLGGLTKTLELKSQIEKSNEVLSLILSILTGAPINEPGNGAPSALQAALSASLAGKQVGDFSNIENIKIKQ